MDTTGILWLSFIGIILGLFIGKGITTWYHRINRRIKLQEAQLYIQIKGSTLTTNEKKRIIEIIQHEKVGDILNELSNDISLEIQRVEKAEANKNSIN